MIELIRHIETLLLENDCVVIPEFGGFITHHIPACWNEEEGVFSPPARSVGFNPQLKMNDGVLAQSYMDAYGTDFPDAIRIIQKQVSELIEVLNREGKVEMDNIGEISLSVDGNYIFAPYNNKIVSPQFYGLDAFEIKLLKALQETPVVETALPPTAPKRTYDIRINRAFVRNAVAAVAAILLFFHLSVPVENTYVEKVNYAQLLPADLFGRIEQQSLLTTPIGEPAEVAPIEPEAPEIEEPAQPEPAPVIEAPKPSKQYHIIIASLASVNDARMMVDDLNAKGYADAGVLTNDNKVRVSLMSYPTRDEATKQLAELRKDNAYKNAWLLIKK